MCDGVPRVGRGGSPCHHGEILQGVFRDPGGRACRGLVTMPMGLLGARATFQSRPGATAAEITVEPADRTKARRAATLAVRQCAELRGCPAGGGDLRLTGDVPVGLGMGSSTSDIIAAVRAVADSYAVTLSPERIARIAVDAECASDPLMLADRPLLFAQREGRVLEVLGDALPATVVVGCATGGGRPVDTLALSPAEYGEDDLDAYERLRATLRRAIARVDVELLGRVCTESARANQRVLAKEELGVLEELGDSVGAVGVQVAHSGNVAGVLFDPGVPDLRRRLRRCIRGLAGHGMSLTRVFRAGAPAAYAQTTDRVALPAPRAHDHRRVRRRPQRIREE